ncbi:MAG: apolipoprotein N-acyltransferase [Candidatus Sumerlaeia bacterium]|nr:apolipoprotein N-acyltransferase [Candidatus Sumerlaeia bacterium]
MIRSLLPSIVRRILPEWAAWKTERRLFALAAASALLLCLAWPRWNLDSVAAFGLAPFLWAVARARCAKQAFYLGWLFGTVFYYVLIVWLNILVFYSWLIPPAIVALAVYLGLFKALFAWMAWHAMRRAPRWGYWLVAAAWTASEYLQSLGDLGFPWGYLGHTLWRRPALIQMAAWTGVYGLSTVLFWCNHWVHDAAGWIADRAKNGWSVRGHRPWGLLVRAGCRVLFGAAMAAAYWSAVHRAGRPDFYSTAPFTVGIVQPNIAQREKYRCYFSDILDEERTALQGKFLTKTVQLTWPLVQGDPAGRCRLLIWPETAVPDTMFNTVRWDFYATFFRDLATSFGAPLLFGADNVVIRRNGKVVPPGQLDLADYHRSGELYSFEPYNSAYLAEPVRGLHPRVYNKTFLVPFAEGMPYIQYLRPLMNALGALIGMQPFMAGTEQTVYEIAADDGGAPLRFGPLICYESCYPALSRKRVRVGAQMLVIITNDGWYERTAGPAQHRLQAVFRAVETRRFVVRCANTGISCVVSPLGRIEAETALAEEAVIRHAVRGVKELTFYTRWGDIFAGSLLAMVAGFLPAGWLVGVVRKRER